MADVSFNEEPVYRTAPVPKDPALVRLVVSWGLAKDAAGAERILLITVGLCALLAFAIFTFGAGGTPPPETPLDPDWPRAS